VRQWIILILLVTSSPSVLGAPQARNELHRYTLMRDRFIIDKDLKKNKYTSFFDLDLLFTAGLKSLIGDVSDANSTGSTLTKTLATAGVLGENVNVEHMLDLEVTAAAPLPYIKYKKYRILPSLFYNMDLGLAFSISNKNAGLTPTAQVYVKKDTKMGLYNRMRWAKGEEWRLAVYQLKRADLFAAKDSTAIAASGDIFDFDELSQDRTSIATDLAFVKEKERYSYLLEFQELQLGGSGKENDYGTWPMLHARYMHKFNGEWFSWSGFYGLHWRSRYKLESGLYIGLKSKLKNDWPFEFILKMSDQFLTFTPQIITKWFHFNYTMKNPYRNPYGDVWTPTIHSINLNFPFP
jgi:hypothetical protein